MGKSTHFSGQPLYSLIIKLLNKNRILQISREHGGERYIKRFDGSTKGVNSFMELQKAHRSVLFLTDGACLIKK